MSTPLPTGKIGQVAVNDLATISMFLAPLSHEREDMKHVCLHAVSEDTLAIIGTTGKHLAIILRKNNYMEGVKPGDSFLIHPNWTDGIAAKSKYHWFFEFGQSEVRVQTTSDLHRRWYRYNRPALTIANKWKAALNLGPVLSKGTGQINLGADDFQPYLRAAKRLCPEKLRKAGVEWVQVCVRPLLSKPHLPLVYAITFPHSPEFFGVVIPEPCAPVVSLPSWVIDLAGKGEQHE